MSAFHGHTPSCHALASSRLRDCDCGAYDRFAMRRNPAVADIGGLVYALASATNRRPAVSSSELDGSRGVTPEAER